MVNQLTTFNDEAQSTCVQLANNLDWQSPMMAAPSCVVLIAHCMALSVNTDDVSLQACRPTNGFKYLEQPKSLRACLRQVSNASYDAMATAQVKMGAVALASGGIPTHIRTMYEALTLYTPREMEQVMPREAEFVRLEAAKCVEWSKDVELKFQATRGLLDELLGCCVEKRGGGEAELRLKELQTKKMIDSLALAERNLREQDAEIQENLAERKQLQREMQQLNNTSTSEKIAGALRHAAEVGGIFCRTVIGLPPASTAPVSEAAPTNYVDPLATFPLAEMYDLDDTYGQLLACNFESPALPELANRVASVLGAFRKIHIFLDMNEYPTALMHYFARTEMNQSAQKTKLAKDLQAAIGHHAQFKTMVRAKESIWKELDAAAREDKKLRNLAKDRLKRLEITSRILERAKEDKELIQQRIADTKNRQNYLMQSLASVRGAGATIDDAIKLLRLVISQLTNLCQEWSKMTLFFEGISVIMAQAGTDVHNTTKSIEDGAMLAEWCDMSNAYKESILRSCVQAHGRAKLINLTSSLYVEVSKTYFLDDLNSLNAIMQMDPAEATREVEHREKRLAQTHSGIGMLVTRKHCQMLIFMEQHAANGRHEYLSLAAAPAEKRKLERQASDVEELAKGHAKAAAKVQQDLEDEHKRARCEYENDAF
ncbi:Aste57867_4274 [Aphanomyces stellatus]|uniref:Aste57867_4274 protein n=1 Tax=Aphanomyces stellatus TaxID=120398 RepID=A0A485KCC7_9STRA|nr:hypothetical protein As57867_004263 [Aphanomyces stellatus]VFT81389.1 Aste57867_4274 [Aphanomyces stellatus]